MDPRGKAGDVERRISTRTSVRMESDDNGDDEHNLALAGMVTDGFRPRHSSGTAEPSTPTLTSASSATLLPDESPGSSRMGRPSSAAKPEPPQFTLSVNHEPNVLTRQTTGSTESTGYIPADGPYQGPTGPTHPYQLYSQNVRSARTLSMATSSTLPMSESSYRGPRGPSHPYANFPSEGIESDAIQAAAIPLGFRGLPDQYQRRVGPEGEEIGDMIGPDGHTEQLPPYTRYPDEAYVRKTAAADGSPDVVHGAAAIVPPILTAPAPTVSSIPGAGGLGLATRNPEFESTDDLSSPHSRHSARSFTSDDSRQRIGLGDEYMSEKREQPKKWQAWMRRKLWGIIPYWAICLACLVLLVMAVVLGAVIGSTSNKQKRPPRKDGSWERQFDVTPIPTPADLQPLPTGRYGLPLLTNRISNTCFEDPTLSKAWSCHFVMSGMYLTVLKEGDDYRVSLDSDHSFTLMNNMYSYGEQPPLVEEPVTLDLVSDKFEPSRGPAWFKMLSYNKTVILPGHLLDPDGTSSSQQNARRVASISAGRSNFQRKGVAQRGDRPWVCNWPGTYLELFIYAQQNSSFSNWGKSSSTSSVSLTTDAEPTSATPTPTPAPTPVEGTDPSTESSSPYEGPTTDGTNDTDDNDQDDADDQDDTDDSDDHTTKHRFPHQRQARWPEHTSSTQPPTTTTITETSTTTTNPSGPVDTNASHFPQLPPPYPRVIKLAERRISTRGAPAAQCTQVEIQGPGEEARVVRDADGKPVVIDIEETEVFMGPPPGRGGPPDSVKRGVGGAAEGGGGGGPPDISPCGCMWFLT